MDVKQYIEQLAQTAGLADEDKNNILKAVSNEKFAKGLEDNILLRSDYSRNMDTLNKQKDEWGLWYQKALIAINENEKAIEQARREKAAYEQLYGPLGGQPANP